ncbi:MAG TPA: PEPxxWA-CTERM sorting domain-containing protein, partial [Phenylobacterium sp.]|uniref:PEPxxWA-CTERM sorting domain-containing protein n=1 Tax=Phenylobacterium sp. TaxID=1871053 RepID=UPI002D06A0F6
ASGGDRTDWLGGGVNDVSNAFISPGQAYNLTAVDLTSLDVLGWGGSNPGDTASGAPNLKVFGLVIGPDAVPEPASWATMILGFTGLGALLRRRRRTAMAAA